MRGRDLNPRPPGYEPDELPNCSTPRCLRTFDAKMIILCPPDSVKGIFSKNRRLREKISKIHSHLCQRGGRRAGRGRDARRLVRSGGRAHPLTDAETGTMDAGGTRGGWREAEGGRILGQRRSRRAGRGRDARRLARNRRRSGENGTGSRRTTPQTIKRYFEKGAHGAALPNFAEMCRSFVENM